MTITAKVSKWWRNVLARLGPRRKLHIVEGDSLPSQMPKRDHLVLARMKARTGAWVCAVLVAAAMWSNF